MKVLRQLSLSLISFFIKSFNLFSQCIRRGVVAAESLRRPRVNA